MVRSAVLISFLLIQYVVFGQSSTPKYSNEFLSIGVDARALAMSKSVVATANDVTAGYWNPAGLSELPNTFQASAMHSAYFAGIANFDYLAFGTQLDSSNFLALSIIRFAIDDIPDTRFLYDSNGAINYDRIQFFSAADYAFLFSYARKIPELKNLQLGGNFKIIHRMVGDFAHAWGFGLEVGAKYNLHGWKLGLTGRDITGTFNAWSHNIELVEDVYLQTGNEIPRNRVEITLPRVILGVTKVFMFKEKVSIQPEIDIEVTFDGKRNTVATISRTSFSPKGGLELGYDDLVYLRFGVGDFQEVKEFDGGTDHTFQPNFGLGVNIKGLQIDYALTDIGNQAEALYSHVFSLKYGWNGKNEK